MQPKVFINYRRDDSTPEALLLRKELEQKFGHGFVFLDTSSIKPGNRWPDKIKNDLCAATIVLSVIGPEWIKAKDEKGERRIDDKDDWVRCELEMALTEEKVIMIVLVRGATLPAAQELPDSLKELFDIQAVSIRNEYWDNDILVLTNEIAQDPVLRIDADHLFPEQEEREARATPNVQPTANRGTKAMLAQVMELMERDWIKDVLERSLQRAAWIELKLDWHEDKVETAANKRRVYSDHSIGSLKSEQSIAAVFKEAGRQLLILGEPGAGKTTVLLKLAKILLASARGGADRPVPIALSLNDWTDKYQNFEQWFAMVFHIYYRVPPKLGREWLNDGRLLLLLDGLDEVPVELRHGCVQAINNFAKEMGVRLPGIVVTSRYEEYNALSLKLKLDEAICLSPLTPLQIDQYLEEGGAKLAPLQAALGEDKILAELVKSPFMLVVCIMAYSGKTADRLAKGNKSNLEERRQQIFKDYVDSAFQRPDKPAGEWPNADILKWLASLARQMTSLQTRSFALQTLQPAWLESQRLQLFYLWVTRTTAVICIALASTLGAFIMPKTAITNNLPQEPLGLTSSNIILIVTGVILSGGFFFTTADFLMIGRKASATARLATVIVSFFAFCVLSSLILHLVHSDKTEFFNSFLVWLLFLCFAAPRNIYSADVVYSSGLGWYWRDSLRRTSWTAGVVAALGFLIAVPIALSEDDLGMGVTFWFLIGGSAAGGALAVWRHLSKKKKINVKSCLFLVLLLVLGGFLGATIGAFFDDNDGFYDYLTTIWIFIGLVFFFLPVFAGLKLKVDTTNLRGRAGAWYWLKPPLLAAALAAFFIIALPLLLIIAVGCVAVYGFGQSLEWPKHFDEVQILSGFGSLILIFGFTGFFRFGGLNWLQHKLLCFLMVWSRRLPPKPANFLEYASKLILLRRRGINYEFIHATFMDYFATRPKVEPTSIATSESKTI